MQVILNGTKVTVVDTKVIGFQSDNLVTSFHALVDTTSEWSYKLDISYSKNNCDGNPKYNIIDLARTDNDCSVTLTAAMLPFNGRWTAQLRGINGDKVYHSETFEIWCKYSIDPTEAYTPVPSEFTQIEYNITDLNNHPPKPNGQTKYWDIWNVKTQQYEQSTIPVGTVLPDVSTATAGMFLTNDGESTVWDTVAEDTAFKFTQSTSSDTWVITHNLNKYPSVTIVDSGNNIVIGDVVYNSENQLTIMFTAAFSGMAYLN